MERKSINKTVLSAMFLAIGLVLPLLTGQIKEVGDSLLPMHLPVMLCGLICGYKHGAVVGLIMPFLRSVIFGMPPMYPNAVWMALELATYGLIIGLVYKNRKSDKILWVYTSLITAMLSGRVVWGVSKALFLGLKGSAFTFSAFLVGGFVDAFLGIVLQLVFIPSVMMILKKIKVGSGTK
jgi:riboflavin transporter FmnP